MRKIEESVLTFQNVLIVSSLRKNSIIFSHRAFFLVFLTKCSLKCPSSTKSSLSWKISGFMSALRHYSFCKRLHRKCLTVLWTRLCHNQNPVISTKIGETCVILKIQTPGILTSWKIQNPEFFAKIVNYFSKALYYRSLTRFWIPLSLNKYSSTCRVTSRYVFYKKYSEIWHIQKPIYHRKLRHIQTYSRPIQTHSAILWYSDRCHIQSCGMFRTQRIFKTLLI